jgi:hypothetical protein
MKGIEYAIMDKDNERREEYPITATTDRGARRQAKVEAERLGIKHYTIVFFRHSDGCRGSIEN